MNPEQTNNPSHETPASSAEILTCNDWIGSRVRVVEGAWKGSEGTVRDVIMVNGALRVKLDDSLTLGWFPSELEKLPLPSATATEDFQNENRRSTPSAERHG